MARKEYTGGAVQTTLSAPIGSGDLSFTAMSGTGFPTGALGNFVLEIDIGKTTAEKVLCSARATGTFTVVTRGFDGTIAQTHTNGATVDHVWDADSATDNAGHVYDTTRDDHTQYAKKALVTTKGDLLVATGSGVLARRGVGVDAQVLTADSTQTDGVKWAAAGGVTSFNAGTGVIAQTNGYGITGANANPPIPAVALTTLSSFISADVTLTGATPVALTSLILAAGTWLVMGRACGENTSGGDAIDLWLSTTSAGGAAAALAAAVVNLMQIDNSWTPSFATILTPGTSTTYYLNIESGGTCTVKAAGTYITPHVVTGLTAVRLA